MALTRCLPVLLLVAMTATTGASEDRANIDVTKCYPAPSSTAYGGSAFRGNLLRLLKALPSAAAPTGFASLQSPGMAASDRALVGGLCSDDSAPEPCRRCLADAGKKMAEQCGNASRHATFSDERCFVLYTDGANFSASSDDEFGAVYFSGDAVPSPDTVSAQRLVALAQSLAQRAAKNYGSAVIVDATTGNRTVRVLAECSAPDCALCLREASLAIARSWEAGGGVQGRVAGVLGFNCHLLFKISTPPTLAEMIKTVGVAVLKGVVQGRRRADGCLRLDEDEGKEQQECSSSSASCGSHVGDNDDEISIGVQDCKSYAERLLEMESAVVAVCLQAREVFSSKWEVDLFL